MKFCQHHWDMLRKAIDDEGLTHLVAKDGATAARQIADILEKGRTTPVNYDPLMAAHWAIVNNLAAQSKGFLLYLMSEENLCPLCEANQSHSEHCKEQNCTFTYDDWCSRAAQDQAEFVKGGMQDA